MKHKYTDPLPDFGDLMTMADFLDHCKNQYLVDYDGTGHPVRDKKMMWSLTIKPSRLKMIPKDATHIMWFNK